VRVLKPKREEIFKKIRGWADDIRYNAEYSGDPNLIVAKEMLKYVEEHEDEARSKNA
jgi:hypothetical protein